MNRNGKYTHSIESYATIEAWCENVPVYAFGYTYVYGVSPTFIQDVVWQEGNKSKPRKIIPKKSWEIKDNKLGSTPPREPKTAANDDQPLLCVHLIDGDPETCWCSRGQVQPNVEDVWIRIDLPKEEQVSSVTLIPSKQDSRMFNSGLGRAFPRILTLKVSRDGWHWKTVYENHKLATPKKVNPIEISFDPRLVKQVWIIGKELPQVLNFGHCFSISGVEVKDEKGNNLALHSRGAGVTVSSTHLGYGMDRFTQDMLWPIQYDMGFKWTRVGYDMGMFLWSYVEREKGKLEIDHKADMAITEAVRNGMKVILVLDKGNWLYHNPPRKVDWKKARTREMMETYYDHQGWPSDSKEMTEGYLRYVDYMVRHFKGRVEYYEICNEWERIDWKAYHQTLLTTIPVIKKADPNARIMLGSVTLAPEGGGIYSEPIMSCLRLGEPKLATQIDAIGWHPWYQADPNSFKYRRYREDFEEFKRKCEEIGFKGKYMATEWTWFAPYPPSNIPPPAPSNTDKLRISEIQKAKYAVRLTITHVFLDVISFWNETFQSHMTSQDVGLLRNTFSADPICPTQPQPIYYTMRTLSTLLEDVKPCSLEFTTKTREIEWYSLKRGNGEVLLAVWIPGTATDDDSQEILTDIILRKVAYKSAMGFDMLNGTEQRINISKKGTDTLLKGIRIKDWPFVIAFK